jgi:mannose-6-phosphate isomerase-like protein (cupin superfamily)
MGRSHVSAGSRRNLSQGITIVDVRNLGCVPAFTTKDGSEIRELLAHRNSCIRNQTLAEARLPPGAATTPHHHPDTEEIYYILEGAGLMRVADQTASVGPGDAIAIPPGASHQITNTGAGVLKFLCCCAPGYEHDDTVLEPEPESGS